MTVNDYTQRFIFERTFVRGERVQLEQSFEQAVSVRAYPHCVKVLLGELSAAAVLLSSALKFEGAFTLQARSNGPIKLLMVECTNQQHYRAVARYDKELSERIVSLNKCLPDGQLLISVDPEQGQRYQSIVVLNYATLAECLTHYFKQSEQLPTQLWLTCDGQRSSGFLLQNLPAGQSATEKLKQKEVALWNHLSILANTITSTELLELENSILLHKIFHEEEIRLFDAVPVQYQCTCSKERTSRSLISLGKTELNELIQENRPVDIQCHFCSKQYRYTINEIQALLQYAAMQ